MLIRSDLWRLWFPRCHLVLLLFASNLGHTQWNWFSDWSKPACSWLQFMGSEGFCLWYVRELPQQMKRLKIQCAVAAQICFLWGAQGTSGAGGWDPLCWSFARACLEPLVQSVAADCVFIPAVVFIFTFLSSLCFPFLLSSLLSYFSFHFFFFLFPLFLLTFFHFLFLFLSLSLFLSFPACSKHWPYNLFLLLLSLLS